ncbi:zinc ribbon domain-containing protein [Niallia endozanthoxylica]|uniref:Transposase n=1 Tax=Niallia endozanthoxylica TaxID=2036016 RepID=A0A5J5I7E1_9BACI|nr:zinc ribbon domain-containing protein [Niallia endozanthoxylica]KAA9031720.1 transposase [Niallia endozanthoxylica]
MTNRQKTIVIKRVPRTVKQHSFPINTKDFEEMKLIAKRYKDVKNYVYSRYSGIHSLLILKNHKKLIRDVWVKTTFAEQWKLPARYWKLALDEAISNIHSLWSNTKNAVRKALRKNPNVTEDEKNYMYYLLKADELLHAILVRETFKKPKKISRLEIRETYIHNLLRRYIRKYKGSIPYSHKETVFIIDAPMYKYIVEGNSFFIEMASLKPRKRIKISLTEPNKYGGNIRIIMKDHSIELHHLVKTKQKTIWNEKNEIGIDKGHKNLLAASSGHLYGEKLNELLNNETERLNKKNAVRNQYWALAKKYEAEGQVEKAQNIWKNNFGKKKYHHQKLKHDMTVKSVINFSLNQFFLIERPSMVISEDLSFVSWNDKFPKSVKRKLSRWIKGYVRKRIEFKCNVWHVEYQLVNAAYTSQTCHKCGEFGNRQGDIFKCKNCGNMHADINASHNIKQRKDDKEIKQYTSYKEVKKILEERIEKKMA